MRNNFSVRNVHKCFTFFSFFFDWSVFGKNFYGILSMTDDRQIGQHSDLVNVFKLSLLTFELDKIREEPK